MGVVRRRLLFLVVPLVVAVACGGSGDGLGLVEVNRPLPALRGATLQGGEVTPADHEGRIVVVNFWATWCGPCREEQPALQRVFETYGDRVRFVGVDERDDTAAARAWIDEFGVGYPSIEDQAGAWADDFGFVGLPDTYVADAGGTIRFLITGATDEAELSGVLDRLLAEPAA